MSDYPDYHQAKYLKSVAAIHQLPTDDGIEVAFIGRSNAGKSSAINTITGIKGLARTSKTPGRTQMINFFELDKHRRLVDLPGYGYANVPRTIQERWAQVVDEYLQQRVCLRGLVLVMDIRHPLKELDQQLIAWALKCQVPIHVLLTKADKLSTNAARKVLREVQDAFDELKASITCQLFSALNRVGLEQAKVQLNKWYDDAQ